MEKTKKLNTAERESTSSEAQEFSKRDREEIISFLLKRYLRERDEDAAK